MSRLVSVMVTHALVPHERYRQLLDIEKRLAAAEAERDGLRLLVGQMRTALTEIACIDNRDTLLEGEMVEEAMRIAEHVLATPPDAAASALWAAAQAMASDLDTLLGGGIEMKPTASGPVTFEAMLMLIQTMAANRDAWRRAAAAGSGEEEAASGG